MLKTRKSGDARRLTRLQNKLQSPTQSTRKAGDDTSPWDDITTPEDVHRVSYEAMSATVDKRLAAHERKALQDLKVKYKLEQNNAETPLRRRQEPSYANEKNRRG